MTGNWREIPASQAREAPEIGAWMLQQIAQDEQLANRAATREGFWAAAARWCGTTSADYALAWRPARVIADCEVRRRIVTELMETIGGDLRDDGEAVLAEHLLRLQCLAFAERPGYRQEWKP